MTALDMAQLLKIEMDRLSTVISAATRRRAVCQQAATRLRLGVSQAVVRAELEAAGETIEFSEEGEPWSRHS